MTDTQANKAIVQRFLGAIEAGDVETIEALQAPDCTWWVIGGGEMCHQRDLAHCAMGAQGRQRSSRLPEREAEAVHAGIQFKQHVKTGVGRRRIEHAQLFLAMHDDG